MNDDTTTTVTPKQREMMDLHIFDHQDGKHRAQPHIGCPSCVFGGEFEPPEGGE